MAQMPSDDELLDFDEERLAHYERADAEAALAGEHGDLFRNHLATARWLDGWVERMAEDPSLEGDYHEGVVHGIQDIAAHLRQGDFLPTGGLLGEG